jgi:hypothetical protein
MEDAMTTKEYADGLRQLADWYEAHPDVHPPYEADQLTYYPFTKDDTEDLVRRIGGRWAKKASSDLLYLTQAVGPFQFRVVVDQATVCQKRVVGHRVIPAQEARLVEVVEWDCAPVLGGGVREEEPVT